MSKVIIRTDTVDGFFARANDAALRADQAQAFDGKVTLSFEDPQRMFTVLSEARQGRQDVGEDGTHCFKSAVQPGAWISEGRALDCSQD